MKENEKDETPSSPTPPYNIFRDSLLRYAGYANEVGESFRYQFPKLVTPSYAVSFGYCFADAASTGWATWRTAINDEAAAANDSNSAKQDANDGAAAAAREKKEDVASRLTMTTPFLTNMSPMEQQNQHKHPAASPGTLAFRATMDTLIWQSLASVMIPGATINLIVKASRLAVRRLSPVVILPAMVSEWFPTAAGLGSIPIIVKPIDASVDVLLDRTIRRQW